MKTVNLPHFAGINNRLPDFQNDVGEAHFLRNAVNVNLTNAGTVKRRKGTVLDVASQDGHSLFANEATTQGYYVDYDKLYSVTVNNAGATNTPVQVLSGLIPGKRMFYDETPLGIICSNGDVLKILSGVTATDLTMPLPAMAPTLTQVAGSLPAGVYQVAVCQINTTTGQQGGTTPPVQIEITGGSGIQVSGLSTNVPHAIYVTPRNGEIFLLAATTQAASITFGGPSIPQGPQCQTLLLQPMPAGALLRYSNGRLYTVIGNTLYYSEPYAPALINPTRGYVPFPKAITMVEPVNDGVYVAADQTYFIGGVITDSTAKPIVPYGATYGCSGRVTNSVDVWWMSDRGVIRASPGGDWKNLQEDVVAVEPARSGAGLFREEDGIKQFIATLFSPETTIMSAKSWMEAEVVRRDDNSPDRFMPAALIHVTSTMSATTTP